MYRVPCDSVYSVVEQMRQAQPIIWWKAGKTDFLFLLVIETQWGT